MRGEFGCDRILARFLEQDLKFESFGNLGLIYTLIVIEVVQFDMQGNKNQSIRGAIIKKKRKNLGKIPQRGGGSK